MRRLAIPLLLVAALSLTGCVSAREVPAPISDAELQAYLEDRVDAAWLNTGLEGIVDRPTTDQTACVDAYRDPAAQQAFYECTQDAGLSTWGATEVDGGPAFTGSGVGDTELDPDEQLLMYVCFAETPSSDGFGNMMLSREELEYLYDYYRDWVVPCIELNDYTLGEVPSRTEFVEQRSFVWLPYYSITSNRADEGAYDGLTNEDLVGLVDRCGSLFPGMPYGEQYGF